LDFVLVALSFLIGTDLRDSGVRQGFFGGVGRCGGGVWMSSIY